MKALTTFLTLAFLSLVGCVGVQPTVPDEPIDGHTFGELAARYDGGTKVVDKIYLAASADGSSQDLVHQLYPPGQASSRRARIREIAWRYPSSILTVFFHKEHGRWVAIGSTLERIVMTD